MDRSVLAVVVVQLVGYGALLAVVPHGQPSPTVELLQRVPVPLLVPVAVLGVPAVALAVGIGAVVAAVGPSPETIPTLLFARGDVLVVVSAYVLGVAGVWAYRRTRKPRPTSA